MSRQADEHNTRDSKKSKDTRRERDRGTFLSIHLVEHERAQIRDGKYDIERALIRIDYFIGEGHSVKLKLRGDGAGVAATLTQGGVEWNRAVNLTAFHNSVQNALITLGMGLEDRYNEFPELGAENSQMEFEW